MSQEFWMQFGELRRKLYFGYGNQMNCKQLFFCIVVDQLQQHLQITLVHSIW